MNHSSPLHQAQFMPAGCLVLMGSGELTASMVEVHKSLLRSKGPDPLAFFIDTPAGFQLNVDEISKRAQEYFQTRVGRPLHVASLKSRHDMDTPQGRQTLKYLQQADYILMGPGSPTYAARHWIGSPVPNLLRSRLADGAVITASSAAALSIGWKTLPVYEIYKVGMDVHWTDGIDLLEPWGLRLVIVPHWNNAEGGTHDTRFCYMGKARFQVLEKLLPFDAIIVGIDEHTALILDFSQGTAVVRGVGTVTLRKTSASYERVFSSGDTFPLSLLWTLSTGVTNIAEELKVSPGVAADAFTTLRTDTEAMSQPPSTPGLEDFWDLLRSAEDLLEQGLTQRDPGDTARALLDLDRLLWEASTLGVPSEDLSQGRETFREWLVLTAQRLALSLEDKRMVLEPVVEDIVRLRQRFREQKLWPTADALRDFLAEHGVIVEDTPSGPRWHWVDGEG